LAILSINNISQGTDTNRVLSKITFLASVLVPLNLVSGVFGMNVPVPFVGADKDNLAPFFTIIGVMAAICAIILSWARWARYI
jgi:magnesium transporter